MNKYYVYAHKRKDNGEIFYIGKGSNNRAYFKSNRSNYWKKIVSKYDYEVIFLENNLDEETAYKMEIIHIANYKKLGQCYANFTNGGDGVNVPVRWWNDKISKALIGKNVAKGKNSKSFKDLITKDELYDLYVVKKYNSIEISNFTNLSITTITARLKMYNIPIRTAGRKKLTILCLNDNKVFNSLISAAKYYKLHRENIKKVIDGKYKHTGNLKFKLIN